MNNSTPLVSVCVIAYNSAKTIVETLESIKNQTYQNIELIISDDGSKDKTVAVSKKWIVNNKNRFVRTQIISVPQNTGVTFNYKRAEEACTGMWVKNIDGDDLLLPSSISDLIAYVSEHSDAVLVYSKIKVFGIPNKHAAKYLENMYDYSFVNKNSEEQIEIVKTKCPLPPMTAFINLQKAREVGLTYDTRIPMMEDQPYMVNAVRLGVKVCFLDKETMSYRVRNNSLSNSLFFSPHFYESHKLFYFLYLFPDEYLNDKESTLISIVEKDVRTYKEHYKYLRYLNIFKNNVLGYLFLRIKRILFN